MLSALHLSVHCIQGKLCPSLPLPWKNVHRLLACLNFSNCTLCSKSVLACLLLLMPLLLLGIFGCLSASCCLPEPPQWRLARIPTCQRLYSFFAPFYSCNLCNFHSTPHMPALFNHLHRAQTGSAGKAALFPCASFPLPTSTTERLGHSKAPEPSSSHGLLCALSLPSRDSYKKPFTPRVDRFSPRITHGSLLWDL